MFWEKTPDDNFFAFATKLKVTPSNGSGMLKLGDSKAGLSNCLTLSTTTAILRVWRNKMLLIKKPLNCCNIRLIFVYRAKKFPS